MESVVYKCLELGKCVNSGNDTIDLRKTDKQSTEKGQFGNNT